MPLSTLITVIHGRPLTTANMLGSDNSDSDVINDGSPRPASVVIKGAIVSPDSSLWCLELTVAATDLLTVRFNLASIAAVCSLNRSPSSTLSPGKGFKYPPSLRLDRRRLLLLRI